MLVLLLTACAGQDTAGPTVTPRSQKVKISLALDWYPNANHAGLYVAQKRGYFDQEGLEVDIFTPGDPATVLQTVATGRDDFGISYQVEVLLARQEEVPVVSVMGIVQHPLAAVMTLKESGIDRPSKLKGRKVGYPGIAYESSMLEAMLEHDGISIKDVELVNVGFDLVPALVGKKVDAVMGAYFTHESIIAENLGFPVNVLRLEQWGVPDFYELVMVTSEKMVREKPDVIQRLVRAVARGYEDAVKEPNAAVDILKQSYAEADEAVERPGINILVPLWKEGERGVGWQEDAKWANLVEWMKGKGILDSKLDASECFTNRFVEALSK
jgi:putative hydroxymethylpyrimidine transport system substrate-binding protein